MERIERVLNFGAQAGAGSESISATITKGHGLLTFLVVHPWFLVRECIGTCLDGYG